MPCGSEYFLEVSGEWPRPASDGRPFGLLVTLGRRDLRPGRGRFTRESTWPHLLHCGRELLEAFGKRLLGAGYVARIDVARRCVGVTSPWPRWCLNHGQYLSALRSLTPDVSDPDASIHYPVSVWFIPGSFTQTDKLVSLSRALPGDEGIFKEALDTGGVRLAIFDNACDILAGESQAETVVGWLRSASEIVSDTAVVWAVAPEP